MNKELSKKYIKYNPLDHVLHRSNMYIGSIEEDEYCTLIFDDKTETIIKKNIKIVPGLYKIFDELVVNVLDHSKRLIKSKYPITKIKIDINVDKNEIVIFNDGEGIEIEKHPEHNVYIPELIFGNMLTSSNYDDTQEKEIGGMNGIGAKACNIFSTKFIVETVDIEKNKKYKQVFENNMKVKNKPIIKEYTKYPFTKITFYPDLKKFNIKKLSNDFVSLMKKRTYDICALTDNSVKVYLNSKKISIGDFEKYCKFYLKDYKNSDIFYHKVNNKCEIVISHNVSGNGLEQISFVNGIWTIKGGKHVDNIVQQIVKGISDNIIKKNKEIKIKPQFIKDNLIIFIKSTIINPAFDSQTKDYLTTPVSKFGSKFTISDAFIKNIMKSTLIERIYELSNNLLQKNLKKTDGKKKNTLRGIPKLDDAINAGTKNSNKCTLILTEGDSAKSMAIAGLSVIGRENYGIFPLKGKLLNVSDLNETKISKNEEINNLKKIIGLETNKKYNNTNSLRYSKILIMTDQDVDGTHIKGLIFNLFYQLWPTLIENDGFLNSMLTPIIKVKRKSKVINFYSLVDYENWVKNNKTQKWDIKYYKGLGTSTNAEAKEYFRDLKQVEYKWNDDNNIDLAFNKNRANDRKEWLYNYNKQNILDYNDKKVSYNDFINKDLIHFSVYDTGRSLPSICDGLKISTRKILYSSFNRNLVKEIRVAQLAGYVSENANYHHGEKSLQDAIIGMAQNYVGSNNINLLMPNGQFGSRIQGGKDAASSRYIHTQLNPIVFKLFPKIDFAILNYINEDGDLIEPEYYLPIIPMILVNGIIGIGTGFSCNIPCFNPEDLIKIYTNILMKHNENSDFDYISYIKKIKTIKPYYKGFKGIIDKNSEDKYYSKGLYERISSNKIEIKELPIGIWTQDYKEFLEKELEKNSNFKDYESHYTESETRFILVFEDGYVNELLKPDKKEPLFNVFEKTFKMITTKNLSITNMHMFNEKGAIMKADTINYIIEYFYTFRLKWYQKRKDYVINKLKKELEFLDSRIRFIMDIINEKLEIRNNKKNNIEDYLEKNNFVKKEDSFDYLIKMPIWNLTYEKKEELLKEFKSKELEMKNMQNYSIQDLWLSDLNELKNSYN
jgi:DNA topoisomerase-2